MFCGSKSDIKIQTSKAFLKGEHCTYIFVASIEHRHDCGYVQLCNKKSRSLIWTFAVLSRCKIIQIHIVIWSSSIRPTLTLIKCLFFCFQTVISLNQTSHAPMVPRPGLWEAIVENQVGDPSYPFLNHCQFLFFLTWGIINSGNLFCAVYNKAQ